jgi:hypothetical protein
MSASRNPVETGPLPFVLLAIERLTEAIETETRDLASPGGVDYRAHAQRKSQGLMELNRLEPALTTLRGHPRLRVALTRLLERLDANERLLHAKLRAARTVAEIVVRAITEGQSDGTYSDQVWRENRR